MVDLSVLRNIDFTSPDNILFLSIFLVLFIIVLVIFFVILKKIVRMIRGLITRVFNVGAKKAKTEQNDRGADLEVVVSELEKSKEERAKIEAIKIAGGDFIRKPDTGEKKEQEEKKTVESQKEKTEKQIEEGLSSLKAESTAEEGTLESKMPSTEENQPKEEGVEEIKIPRAKVIGEQSSEEENNAIKSQKGPESQPAGKGVVTGPENLKSVGSAGGSVLARISNKTVKPEDNLKIPENLDLHGSSLIHEKNKTEAVKRMPQLEEKELVEEAAPLKIEEPALGAGLSSQQPAKDTSIFGGKSEISRSELRQKLKQDVGVFKAEKQTGLDMTPVQRAKLEKEVFSSALGGNISKADLKRGIKKLNEKLSGAKSSVEHARLRKEIKFFKKIGNVK